MTDDRVDAFFDGIAEEYAGYAAAPLRADYEWPAVRSLLPALEGARVLEAACGPGDTAARLADRGADVLGVDASREMIRVARRRHGDVADFRRADLREPLACLDDGGVDAVLSQLTLGHVEDWEPVLGEFHRVLAVDGTLVLSVSHPFSDYLALACEDYPPFGGLFGAAGDGPTVTPEREPPRYADIERFEGNWGDDGAVGFVRRPLSAVARPLFDAGFALTGLEEPVPTAALEARRPEQAESLRRRPPPFLCLRGEKR